jgi:hypothetical protein
VTPSSTLITQKHNESGRMWYAPWRADSQPLISVVHGVHAFISVVEFWQAKQSDGRATQFAFACRRHQVHEAVNAIRAAPELTEHDQRLLQAVSIRIARCHESTVDPDLMEIVTQITDDHRAIWQLRHNELDHAAAEHMASAWLSGSTAPELPHVIRVKSGVPITPAPARQEMLKAKALQRDPIPDDNADAAYVRGDHDSATAGYLARIRDEPEDLHAWAGLALTTKSFEPDVTLAVHREIRDRGWQAPDPIELSAWMNS